MAGRGHSGSSGSAAFVYVDEKSVKDLQAIGAHLKSVSDPSHRKALTKQLGQEIREAAEPMRRDIAQAARDLKFERTSRAGASRSRREGRVLKSGRFKAGRGLRDGIAQGIRTQINMGRTAAGVRIRLASKDPVINRLGKVVNNKGKIRHPLFGDTEHWYDTQTTNGRGWFYNAAYPHRRATEVRVRRVLDKWVDDIARGITRAG
jgi:hypothetical protein